jgi:Photoprotection regulator fluorescence recovery protein
MHDENWSKSEKAVARQAFDAAFSREFAALTDEVRKRANSIAEPDDIWELHSFLSRQRKMIDEKYDYRYSQLVFVFAQLIREDWLTEAELAGLDEDKLARIRSLLEV